MGWLFFDSFPAVLRYPELEKPREKFREEVEKYQISSSKDYKLDYLEVFLSNKLLVCVCFHCTKLVWYLPLDWKYANRGGVIQKINKWEKRD